MYNELKENLDTMTCTKDILTLSVEIGDAMLRNGAEIYRVEDSLIHILESYDVENIDVYVLSNGIFASANRPCRYRPQFQRLAGSFAVAICSTSSGIRETSHRTGSIQNP